VREPGRVCACEKWTMATAEDQSGEREIGVAETAAATAVMSRRVGCSSSRLRQQSDRVSSNVSSSRQRWSNHCSLLRMPESRPGHVACHPVT
jgi:hypothetical protein